MLRAPQLERTNSSPVWRQVIVFVVGGVTLTVGLVMLVFPGPAIVLYRLVWPVWRLNFDGLGNGFHQHANGSVVASKNHIKTRNEPNHEYGQNEA
jgi:hypothetical protein